MESTTTDAVFNGEELLRRCMGNANIVERILTKFQDRFAADLKGLEQGLMESDIEVITGIAHRIKGSSANVSAASICEIATEIEQLGRSGELAGIAPHLERLKTEWKRFAAVVSEFDLPAPG